MQEELREKLLDHQKKYGSTLQFIAIKIGVHRSTLSLFKNKKRSLAKVVAEKLENYLNQFS